MFTLGIFTTHIPYIALVVFYAFFWIVGVNKATSGELQPSESRLSIESPAIEMLLEADQDHFKNAHNSYKQHFFVPNHNIAFAALKKLRYKCFDTIYQTQSSTGLTLFSRPPPFLS